MVLCSLLAVACLPARRASLGVECELNSECDTPLVCRLGFCRNECASSGDCSRGLDCLLDSQDLGACQLPDEAHCVLTAECPTGLVCRFSECANACETDRDCPGGSRCEMDTDGLACFDRSEQPCNFDTECAPESTGMRCLSGRCRRECFTDRDCRNDFRCNAGVCSAPFDAAVPDVDAAADGGMGSDAGVPPTTCTAGPLSDVTTFDHNGGLGCAVVDGGTSGLTPGVYCWGQVTDAAFLTTGMGMGITNVPCANRIAFLGTTVWDEIVLVGSGACVRQGANIECWGADDLGQIPDGLMGIAVPVSAPFTVPVAGVDGLFRGEAGGIFARQSGTAVFGWGTSMGGHLGDGTSGTTRHDMRFTLPIATGGMRDLASSSQVTCAVEGGAVSCSPSAFQGVGSLPSGIRAIGAGTTHVCATDGASVYCWGSNAHGELGTGDVLPTTRRVPVLGLPTMGVRDVDLGGDTSCALMADGSVWCWGAPGPIDPTRGTFDFVLAPTQIMTDRTMLRVDGRVICALGNDGRVLCIGDGNLFLGYGAGVTPTVPVNVQR